MKKYITTDKHPELKEGIILLKHASNSEIYETTKMFTAFYKESVEMWFNKGYIKEVEEKEFTKSDMINFANWPNYSQIRNDQENLDNWLKRDD